ncbi:MAG: preprotein translocase subunit SecY [Spirochaetaceae bacterium]|nr:MAG: preprotein translocase subunit SecY [Spirochaetaceae bacterium]
MASNALINIFRTQELRKRILFTLFMLVVFRLGATIPLPGIDFVSLRAAMDVPTDGSAAVNIMDYIDMFSGGAFKNYSLMMLGIMPYITTSIVFQLLVIIIPALKKVQEEEGGRKKIQRYQRYATVVVCLFQSYFMIDNIVNKAFISMDWVPFIILAIVTVTTGTLFLMWIGEQITQRGIGNGTSLIIFAGIVVRIPDVFFQLGIVKSLLTFVENILLSIGVISRSGTLVPITTRATGEISAIYILMAAVMFVVVVGLIIYEQRGQRKIPIHYAKRVVGRKIYGSQNTYLPFKLNPSGVIPIIFANAIMILPLQLFQSLGQNMDFFKGLAIALRPDGFWYMFIYIILIIVFAYFYTQVSLNPGEISKQIRENGGSIPGIRSEKMEEYLNRILSRIILPGSLFLAMIALIPTLITKVFAFPYSVANIMGGTSLIILVGVGLDTMSQVESYLRMHHHEGLTKKGKIKARNL